MLSGPKRSKSPTFRPAAEAGGIWVRAPTAGRTGFAAAAAACRRSWPQGCRLCLSCVSGSPQPLPRGHSAMPCLHPRAGSALPLLFEARVWVRPTLPQRAQLSKTSHTCSTCSAGSTPGAHAWHLGSRSRGRGHGHRSLVIILATTHAPGPGDSHLHPYPHPPKSPPKPWCVSNASQVWPSCGQRAPQGAVGREGPPGSRTGWAGVGSVETAPRLPGGRAQEAARSAPGRAAAFLQREGRSAVPFPAAVWDPQARAELTAVPPMAPRSRNAPQPPR